MSLPYCGLKHEVQGRAAPAAVAGTRLTYGCKTSDNANPSGLFFTLFLRSFILLRELECVVGASVGRKPCKRRPTVREGVCRFAIHTQAWSSPREEGLRYK